MDRGGTGRRRFASKIHSRPISRSHRENLFPYGVSGNQAVDGYVCFKASLSDRLFFCGGGGRSDCIFLFSDKENGGPKKQNYIPHPIDTEFFRFIDIFLSAAVGI